MESLHPDPQVLHFGPQRVLLLDGDHLLEPLLDAAETTTQIENHRLQMIEAGFDPNVEPLDVVPAVHDIVKQLAIQAETKQIDVKLELPEDIHVMATPGRLKQALMNLISNAIKYTPDGGHVTVAVTADTRLSGAEIVTIRVSDTGHGIPAKDLPHVFDKFFRVKNETTDRVKGTEELKGVVIDITGAVNDQSAALVSAGSVISTSASVYDDAGRLTQATDAFGHQSQLLYDATGLVSEAGKPMAAESDDAEETEKVVTLDAFRKK